MYYREVEQLIHLCKYMIYIIDLCLLNGRVVYICCHEIYIRLSPLIIYEITKIPNCNVNSKRKVLFYKMVESKALTHLTNGK